MREFRTSGSVGRAPGNWCLYPEVLTSMKSVWLSQYITAIAGNGIRNGYHMFADATGIDDITTVQYEKK